MTLVPLLCVKVAVWFLSPTFTYWIQELLKSLTDIGEQKPALGHIHYVIDFFKPNNLVSSTKNPLFMLKYWKGCLRSTNSSAVMKLLKIFFRSIKKKYLPFKVFKNSIAECIYLALCIALNFCDITVKLFYIFFGKKHLTIFPLISVPIKISELSRSV